MPIKIVRLFGRRYSIVEFSFIIPTSCDGQDRSVDAEDTNIPGPSSLVLFTSSRLLILLYHCVWGIDTNTRLHESKAVDCLFGDDMFSCLGARLYK